MSRRVVITGVGLLSTLGIGTEPTWKGLLMGRSGVARITSFNPIHHTCTIAAEVKNFDPLQYIEKKELKKWAGSFNSPWRRRNLRWSRPD